MFNIFKKKDEEKKVYRFPSITTYDIRGKWEEYGVQNSIYEFADGRFKYSFTSDSEYTEYWEGRVEIVDGCMVQLVCEYSKTTIEGQVEEEYEESVDRLGYYMDGKIITLAKSAKEKNGELTLELGADAVYINTKVVFKDGLAHIKGKTYRDKLVNNTVPYTVEGSDIRYQEDEESRTWIKKYDGDYFVVTYVRKEE